MLHTEHWREALDRRDQDDTLVPAKLPACARRQQQQQRPYRVEISPRNLLPHLITVFKRIPKDYQTLLFHSRVAWHSPMVPVGKKSLPAGLVGLT